METQENNKKKSNSLTKRILRISTGWKVVLVLFFLTGTFAVGYYSVVLIGKIYEEITSDKYFVSEEMGNGYEVRTYYDGPSSIALNGKRRAVVKDVDYVEGNEEDSLWIVYKDYKAAFFNTQTGQLTTPFVYDVAWLYSEGVAAVVDSNSRLFFINPQGGIAFNQTFPYNQQDDYGYQFHHGMCQVLNPTGFVGLINKKGEWVFEPCYDSAAYDDGYWWLTRNDSLMVIDSNGSILIGMTLGQELRVSEEGNLEVWHKLYPGRLYDASGKLLAHQVYWKVDRLTYYDDGDDIATDVLEYYTDYGQCGLMTLEGRPLTDARYYSIIAVSKTLFRARYRLNDEGDNLMDVLLNEKGELVETNK